MLCESLVVEGITMTKIGKEQRSSCFPILILMEGKAELVRISTVEDIPMGAVFRVMKVNLLTE